MESSFIDQHWMGIFGVEAEAFAAPLTVIEHGSPFFADYSGAWIFERQGRYLITVPSGLREEIAGKVATIPADRCLTEEGARALFGERVLRVIGPAYQGVIEPETFTPFTAHVARLLTPDDNPTLATLLSECDPENVEDSGVEVDSTSLHGCFQGDKLVAVAKEVEGSPYAVGIGILTHPNFRGQGYGKAAVSAAVSAIFAQGKVVCYQTLVTNVASVSIASALGGREYARHLAVRLRL